MDFLHIYKLPSQPQLVFDSVIGENGILKFTLAKVTAIADKSFL